MNEAGGNAPMCLGEVRGRTGGTREARDRCPQIPTVDKGAGFLQKSKIWNQTAHRPNDLIIK